MSTPSPAHWRKLCTEDDEPGARLAVAMSEISEDGYCAGWLIDLEYSLWEMLHDPTYRDFGMTTVSEADLDELRRLSAECDGWVVYTDDRAECLVPLAEWTEIAARRSKDHRHT